MKSRLFLFISLGTDILIAVSKFVAAAVTGSASMTTEGIHSIIDTISQFMLIMGVKRSRRQPDEERPFGYGRELYFWSFMVSLVIFSLGGCISVYEGVIRFKRPYLEGNPLWNYATLAFAFVFNLISMISALRAFNKQRGRTGFWKAVKGTKDPSTIIVLLGDVGDLIGLIIAFLGIFLGRLFNNYYYDAIASIIIGVILILISAVLIRESKSLLMGETISRRTIRQIIKLVEADGYIIKVRAHYSIYRSPDDILLQLNAVFKDNMDTRQITSTIERVIATVKAKYPLIKQLFIEPVAR